MYSYIIKLDKNTYWKLVIGVVIHALRPCGSAFSRNWKYLIQKLRQWWSNHWIYCKISSENLHRDSNWESMSFDLFLCIHASKVYNQSISYGGIVLLTCITWCNCFHSFWLEWVLINIPTKKKENSCIMWYMLEELSPIWSDRLTVNFEAWMQKKIKGYAFSIWVQMKLFGAYFTINTMIWSSISQFFYQIISVPWKCRTTTSECVN